MTWLKNLGDLKTRAFPYVTLNNDLTAQGLDFVSLLNASKQGVRNVRASMISGGRNLPREHRIQLKIVTE